MASTSRSKEDTKEFFDSPEVLEKKAAQMVEMIRRSKHFIVFTVLQYDLCFLLFIIFALF